MNEITENEEDPTEAEITIIIPNERTVIYFDGRDPEILSEKEFCMRFCGKIRCF